MFQTQISPQIGHFYHVYNQGNNRQNIFFERDNYLYFLRLIRQSFITHTIDIVAYCLMPNHYHLLVYPKSEHLSQNLFEKVADKVKGSIEDPRNDTTSLP